MFIKLTDIKNKYDIKVTSVIHVGAHNAQELQSYKDCGAEILDSKEWKRKCT